VRHLFFLFLDSSELSLIRSANHRQERGAHTAPGEGDAPRTPWAWVPELDDDDSPTQPDSGLQYHSAQQSLQPSPVEPGVRPNGATASAASGTGFPGSGPGHQAPPPHAYFSVPADQQQQQQHHHHHHQSSTTETGSSSRPVLPPPAVYSTHVRQQSNNPPQTTTATHHHHPSAAPASHPATSLPSQPSAQAIQRSHTLAAPTPQRPGQPESFTSVKQLRPTFSPNIVRTPNHYRQDSHSVIPSPRVSTWDEANSHSAGASTSANKHLSGAMQSGGVVPSPRVLPWSAHARANDGGSPTPAPRQPRTSRTEPSRIYASSTRPSQPVQRSYSIPEVPRQPAPVSRQNSMPVVPGGPDSHRHHHHSQPSIADLPQFAEEPGVVTSLSPLVGTGSVSSESSTSTIVVAQSPPPLFVPPRYSDSPSPSPQHRRSRSSSPSSSPSSSDSDSEDSDPGGHRRRRGYRSPTDAHGRHRTYSGQSGHHHHHRHHHHHPHSSTNNTNRYSGSSGGYPGPGAHTPQGRSPASSTHTYQSSSSSNPLPTPPQERRGPGFSLPPAQLPEPPQGTYSRQLRYGFWNRRGDYLTMDKYVVYAPPGHTNPPDLKGYPSPTDGYMDHYGNFLKYDPTLRELPESLPRQGQPPQLPYDKVSSPHHRFFFFFKYPCFFFLTMSPTVRNLRVLVICDMHL